MEALQEQLEAGKQAAADAASKAAEAHAVELQKLAVERTKLEVGEGGRAGLRVQQQPPRAGSLVRGCRRP